MNQTIHPKDSSEINQILLSGTCYWCMEAIFQSLIGVEQVLQGWVSEKSSEPNSKKTALFSPSTDDDAFFEGIVVKFDPKIISLSVLIDIHLHTHNPTARHSLRDRYPSAVYVYKPEHLLAVQAILDEKANDFSEPLLTNARLVHAFTPSQDAIQNYFYKNPQKPFCQSVISPKLKHLMNTYKKWVLTDKADIIAD